MKYKGKDKQNGIMSPIYDKDPPGLTCTCPHNSANEDDSWRRKTKDDVCMPKFRLSGETQYYRNNTTDADSDTASSSYKPRQYRRSVSLNEILNSDVGTSSGHYSDDQSSPVQPHSDGLTSRGSTVYPGSSSDASPDGNVTGHELSDFEKENLLFLKDLDNNKSFRNMVDTGMARPLQESLSYTSLGSCSSESLTGDSTPRGGSPYPGRKDFHRSTYSPAKKAPSGIMRSISREEPEDDLSESEVSQDEHKDAMLLPRGGRRISLPPLSFSRTSSASSLSSAGGCGPAWWNTRSVRDKPVPPRRSLSPGPGTVARARRIYSYRSLSSPGDNRLHEEEESILHETAPWMSPRTPTKLLDASWRMEETLHEDSQDTEQEPNKKNHIAPRPVKTDLIPNGTSDSNNVRTPTGPLEPPTSNNATEEAKKPTPMAFTVDLGGSPGVSPGDGSGGEAAKKLDIGASISKWAPKHRRNLSLTKVEENKVSEDYKVEEGVGKPPVGRPRSGTVGSSGGLLSGVRRIGGYHSEGYFSSDQDDDQANKRTQHTELKSPRSPKTPELRSPLTPQRVARTISQDSAKGPSLRKHSSKSECEAYSPNTKKSSILELTAKSKGEPDQKSDKMSVEVQNMTTSIQSISSCQTYDVNKEDLEFNKEVVADDVSETGTYTIEKDSSSPEVEQARNNIDQVFGVSATESEADVNRQRPVSTATEDNWELNVENDKYKCSTSLSRSSPNWIQQWAAQVAEHTKAPEALPKDGLVSPRGSKAPLTSLSSSQESSDSRPRRKLPTPPAYTPSSPHASVALTSSRTSDISDHETSNKSMRDPYDKPRSPLNQNRSSPLAPSRLPISQSRSPHGQKSLEYLRDSECFLRDTQQLMTSLQARVNKGKNPGNRGLSFESHDSGGDSDIDTSTSYANTDQDSRLSKALKNKIKSNTIDSLTRQIAVVTSPKRTEVKSGHHLRRERSSMSEVGYEAFAARHEDQTLPSDSSSETSDHAKDCRKNSDNNPPLKFNRAFSLRRARLDEPPPQKNEKKKIARPSSAGTNSRRTPLNTNKSSQGEYGTRGSSSQATTPKSNSSDFNRGDGGRFSLRLPRSASTTAVAKSPSRTSVKKELQHGVRKNIGLKSNSTMSSKEADFQNWKRRKSYDPMKAAAEGRKKQLEMKEQQPSQERTPSPEPLSLLRSQSFHGPEGMAVNNRWPRRPNNLYGSEEEGPYSLEEEQQQHVPQLSPIRRSPTSPHHLSSPSHSLSPHRQAQINAARRRGSYTLSDEGETNGATLSRKTSLDESGSEGKRSPMGSTRGVRSKAKSEALDNLVISTIHSLSVKVRTTSETLLQRLKSQYDEDGDRAALLEEVLAHLSESDQNLSSTQTHSTSRELAGILRNLKKIESALQVIDQVILSEDEEEQDDDDDLEDGTHNNHWGDDY